MENEKIKNKLSIQEQINHMKQKGIVFDIDSEEQVKNYLENNTSYFKLRAYRKKLSQRIKEKRKSLNLTQEELANLIQTTKQTIYKYENEIVTNIPYDRLILLADVLKCTPAYLMGWESEEISNPIPVKSDSNMVRIPILGSVRAGAPEEAYEDIIGYEDITQKLARNGKHYALQIRGDSMEPRFMHGDIVIIREQSIVNPGEIGIFIVNGCDATIKKFNKDSKGIYLIPLNTEYPVQHYTKKEAEELPVLCIGKVVELRTRF